MKTRIYAAPAVKGLQLEACEVMTYLYTKLLVLEDKQALQNMLNLVEKIECKGKKNSTKTSPVSLHLQYCKSTQIFAHH